MCLFLAPSYSKAVSPCHVVCPLVHLCFATYTPATVIHVSMSLGVAPCLQPRHFKPFMSWWLLPFVHVLEHRHVFRQTCICLFSWASFQMCARDVSHPIGAGCANTAYVAQAASLCLPRSASQTLPRVPPRGPLCYLTVALQPCLCEKSFLTFVLVWWQLVSRLATTSISVLSRGAAASC